MFMFVCSSTDSCPTTQKLYVLYWNPQMWALPDVEVLTHYRPLDPELIPSTYGKERILLVAKLRVGSLVVLKLVFLSIYCVYYCVTVTCLETNVQLIKTSLTGSVDTWTVQIYYLTNLYNKHPVGYVKAGQIYSVWTVTISRITVNVALYLMWSRKQIQRPVWAPLPLFFMFFSCSFPNV